MIANPRPEKGGWLGPVLVALAAWTFASVNMLVSNWLNIQNFSLPDPDDAMRMAQVRDLLAGQAWWDLTQYRINPVHGGALMHWSRLVDAPIAGGILLLEPFLGRVQAERFVMAGLPVLIGAMLSVACALGYRNLPDRRIAWFAPAMMVTLGFVVVQYRPLHIDHHGWQILLGTVIFWQALRPPTRQAGLIGGIAGAALLSISIEGLPMVTLFAGLAAFRWALYARRPDRDWLCFYLAGLAGGAIGLQFLMRGPGGLAGTWCDSLSAPYLAAFAVAAGLVAVITRVDPASRAARFLLLGVAGMASAAVLLGIEPLCAKGPFASLDPIVRRYWYSGVIEGQPITSMKLHDALFVILPSLLGLIGSAIGWIRAGTGEARRTWTTVFIALAAAAALSMLVIRSCSTAHIFALPGCATLVLAVWDRARTIRFLLPRVLASASVLLLTPLPASMATVWLLGHVVPAAKPERKVRTPAASTKGSCLTRATVAALQEMAPTTIATPIDLGPSMLFRTHHRVIATGHHRNAAAMADDIRIFISDPAQAETYVRKHQAAFVVFCPAAADAKMYRKANAHGLLARLMDGNPPPWLEPVKLEPKQTMSVWRVKPAAR